ncbi:MAG: DUF2306 domain-containing protein [Flavobacteriaceae bacterium]
MKIKLKSILKVLGFVILLLYSLLFILQATRYYTFQDEILGRFLNVKWWLIGHISGGILALLIGPFQFISKFKNKYNKLHKKLGKTYLIAILISGISSTVLAWTAALDIHWTWGFSLQILAVVWVISSYMAYISIRKKRIQQHKEWMIRSYIITLAFVLFRMFNDITLMAGLGTFIERAPTIVWASWSIPLFFTEIVFQLKKSIDY